MLRKILFPCPYIYVPTIYFRKYASCMSLCASQILSLSWNSLPGPKFDFPTPIEWFSAQSAAELAQVAGRRQTQSCSACCWHARSLARSLAGWLRHRVLKREIGAEEKTGKELVIRVLPPKCSERVVSNLYSTFPLSWWTPSGSLVVATS